ncbi:MAG: orotate phosphoribosyltransferase [Bacteroidetes bacterium]|nr:orotate phosphoribosyltransferase [Bacteroidota bacterium]
MPTEISTLSPQQLAAALLEIDAFKLRPEAPFQWASGWKSPVYCDNRQTLSYPALRSQIAEALCGLVRTHFPQARAVAGVATAGIPQATLVADRMGLALAYVRSSPKAHGMGNQIEGKLAPGQPVVVVEDLVSTGKSSLQAVQALREAGYTVAGLVCIFTYGFAVADNLFAEQGVELRSLTNLEALIAAGLTAGKLQPQQVETIRRWQQQPDTWTAL